MTSSTTPDPITDLFAARRRADPRDVLRMTDHTGDPLELPLAVEALVGGRRTGRRVAFQFVLFLAISVAAVWFITVNAWDHDGFFPWFWNVIWALFPWFFLAPLWLSWFRSNVRARRDGALYRDWQSERLGARRTVGRVTGAWHNHSESGGVTLAAIEVAFDGRTAAIARLAPASNLLPSELPQVGDEVALFVLPSGRVVVQASRIRTAPTSLPRRAGSAAPDAAPADADDLTSQLATLAELHASGALSDAEFAAAKAKLLG